MMLLDGTIVDNIVFGESTDLIDLSRVQKALQAACLLDFINSQPLKLDTAIGENGLFLSGGQRRRLCIARALYRNPKYPHSG